MNLTEIILEKAAIELFEAEGCKHLTGAHIYKEMADASMQHHFKDAIP